MKLSLGFSGNGVTSDKKPMAGTKVLIRLFDGTGFEIWTQPTDKVGQTPVIREGDYIRIINKQPVKDGVYEIRYPFATLEVENNKVKSFKLKK